MFGGDTEGPDDLVLVQCDAGESFYRLPGGAIEQGAARVVAASLLAEVQGGEQPQAYAGAGTCYVEFGGGRVGRADVDFLSGPSPTGSFIGPSVALVGEKQHFGSSRRARWFGL